MRSSLKTLAFLGMVAALCGCVKNLSLTGFGKVPKPFDITYEAFVVNNPQNIEVFYCRSLFEKGTGEGHAASKYSDAATRKPIVMTGKLKSRENMQKELIVCGLMNFIDGGKGRVSITRNVSMRVPLLDMRHTVMARQLESGEIAISGMPNGLPNEVRAHLKKGESLVALWFDKNGQLTIVRWTVD